MRYEDKPALLADPGYYGYDVYFVVATVCLVTQFLLIAVV